MGHVLSRDESGQRPLEEVTGQQRIRRPTGLDRTLRGMATLFSDIRFWDVVCGLAMGANSLFRRRMALLIPMAFPGGGYRDGGRTRAREFPASGPICISGFQRLLSVNPD